MHIDEKRFDEIKHNVKLVHNGLYLFRSDGQLSVHMIRFMLERLERVITILDTSEKLNMASKSDDPTVKSILDAIAGFSGDSEEKDEIINRLVNRGSELLFEYLVEGVISKEGIDNWLKAVPDKKGK